MTFQRYNVCATSSVIPNRLSDAISAIAVQWCNFNNVSNASDAMRVMPVQWCYLYVFDDIPAMQCVCYQISNTKPVQRYNVCAIAVQRYGMGAVSWTMLCVCCQFSDATVMRGVLMLLSDAIDVTTVIWGCSGYMMMRCCYRVQRCLVWNVRGLAILPVWNGKTAYGFALRHATNWGSGKVKK